MKLKIEDFDHLSSLIKFFQDNSKKGTPTTGHIIQAINGELNGNKVSNANKLIPKQLYSSTVQINGPRNTNESLGYFFMPFILDHNFSLDTFSKIFKALGYSAQVDLETFENYSSGKKFMRLFLTGLDQIESDFILDYERFKEVKEDLVLRLVERTINNQYLKELNVLPCCYHLLDENEMINSELCQFLTFTKNIDHPSKIEKEDAISKLGYVQNGLLNSNFNKEFTL